MKKPYKISILTGIIGTLCLCIIIVLGMIAYANIRKSEMKAKNLNVGLESESQIMKDSITERKSEKPLQPQLIETETISVTEESEILSESNEELTEEQSEPRTEISRSDDTAAYTVAIDPGHQGSWVDMSGMEPMGPDSSEMKAKATTGTTGRYSGIGEYQLNLDISLMLREELENRGYRVVMIRSDHDTAVSNIERTLMAYEEGGDIFVRIHANGSEDGSINGALGMTPGADNPYVGYMYDACYQLTERILNAYCIETGMRNMGILYYNTMTGINWSKIPVTILEMGYMTNEHDDLLMADEAFRQKMVLGIANGIDDYFGE